MPKVNWKSWAKMGFAAGLFWGIIITGISMLLGVALSGTTGLLIGLGIGGLVGIGFLIVSTIFGGIQAIAGRAITNIFKFQSKKDYWRVFQVLFTGSIAFAVLAYLLAGTVTPVGVVVDVVMAVISSLVSSWIVIYMFKRLKWRLPDN